MSHKITLKKLQKMKGVEKIVMITAYDALFAAIFDPYVDMILVGDSLNMSFSGREDTVSATMDQMIYHAQAVCSKTEKSFVLFDMPFGSYSDKETALKNAIRAYRETGVDAIKLEGGREKAEIIRHLSDNAMQYSDISDSSRKVYGAKAVIRSKARARLRSRRSSKMHCFWKKLVLLH